MLLDIVRLVLAGVIGYLAGSFPSGVIVGKVRGVDVLAHGSGHTGATNVLRTAGGKAAAAVVVLDIAKGVVAVLLARYLIFPASADAAINPWAEAIAGMAAILGHNFSLFLHFRGGRGVATGGGASLAMNPLVVLIALVLGALPVIFTRYVSLGSITAAAACPLADLGFVLTGHDSWAHFAFMLAGGLLIIISHYDNIQRLLAGTERKLGERAKAV
ncbi:MAG TPA: glycerol-3-phosphate 1-O-acyltransferase PlsY [Ktedonobacterales bacterium]|nr:glycerol-3-phosphate 1-O-acyltransferase PlsY [Ktedonobacterales bacterium]